MSKKITSRAVSAAVTVLLVISTLLCFTVILKAAVGNDISFFGYRFFYISSGSMSPALPVGSVIVVHKGAGPYEVGDIITFHSKESAIYGRPNTHRIIGVQNAGGQVSYTTRGDANASADMPAVSDEDIIGRVVWQTGALPFAGNLFAFLGTRLGFLLLILLPLLFITIGCMRSFIAEYKRELRRMAEEMSRAGNGEKRGER